jgi:hypothetical protein
MAGLLDIFGTSGADTMGLLGMSQADIARNREDAQAQALYALAGRLFQGGNTGQSIVEGLQQGQKAYKGGMNEAMQNQLQSFQLQELLRKRKEEELTKSQQLQAQQVLAKAYRPETFAETPLTNMFGQEVAGPNQPQAAGGGLKAAQRELMALGPAGMAALTTASGVEKALRPEGYTLGEGQIRYEIGADGKPVSVATGAQKKEDIAGDLKEARQFLGITSPVNEMTTTERALVKAYIDRKDLAKAPKVSVDLKDPTAVAMAGLKMQGDIRQDLKGPKDTATAYQTMYNAATNPTQKGDTTMLYTFFKVLDPQSTVREGEIEMIKQSRSIPEKFKGMALKLASGQTLLESERADLLNQAYQYVSNQQRGVTETIDMYKDYAKAFGLNPEKAVPNPFADIKKPPSKTVMINKKQTVAKLADDGNYYIQSGTNTDGTPKYFKVD